MDQLIAELMTEENIAKLIDPPIKYVIHKMAPYIIILNIIIISLFIMMALILYRLIYN